MCLVTLSLVNHSDIQQMADSARYCKNQRRAAQRKRAWWKRVWMEKQRILREESAIQKRVFLTSKASDIHKRLMRDLWYTTHCHGCNEPMHFIHNYVNQFCSKGCWKESTDYDDGWTCDQPECPHCAQEPPTLAQAAHLRIYYKTNPMCRRHVQGRFYALWPTGDRAWQERHGWDTNIHRNYGVLTFPMQEAMGM